jgi:uncharacterized protein
MRWLNEAGLDDLVIGSTILGAGGGGDPYIGRLLALDAIRRSGPVQLVALADVPDDAQVACVAAMGAPTVIAEKLPRASGYLSAFEALQRRLGRQITHVCPIEAGGLNAITPVIVAAALRLPMLDADGMGRAFPRLELVTPTLYGGSATPLALVDERGIEVIVEAPSNDWAERVARAATVATGCMSAIACYPMSGAEARAWLIDGALALAEQLGRSLRDARARKAPAVAAILERSGGVDLLAGKIVEVERRTERGWNLGRATIAGVDGWRGSELELHFQNEHLVAFRDGRAVATVPDLIMVLESETGEPIPAEEIRYGARASVIAIPCDPHWRTAGGLRLAGPRAFGYELDYAPIGTRDG